MDFSAESDIDSTVTPIELSPHHSHGQLLESDSLSELYLSDYNRQSPKFRRKPPPHRPMKSSRHRHDRDREESDEDQPAVNKEDLGNIYQELQAISDKLKEENRILHEREAKLKERERMIVISQSNIQTITDHEVKQRWQALQQQHQDEVAKFEQALRERTKENKRLKENFETLKQANDALKKELEITQMQKLKLEKQVTSSQARLTNLQRKQEFDQRQREGDVLGSSTEVPGKQSKLKQETDDRPKQHKVSKAGMPAYDILSALLDWVCDAHLRHAVTDQPTQPIERFSAPDYVQDKILRVLPSLVEILKEVPLTSSKFCLPCLQFIYWSLMNVEQGHGQQKTSLSSTLRRLGEEVYRARVSRNSDSEKFPSLVLDRGDKQKEGLFFRSSNLHIRLLSSLIILKTLTQADLLAQVFDVLKTDLKSDVAKELFLYYQATPVITVYLKPVNKVFMGPAVDILLQLSTDSPFTTRFLESCSTEHWFRTVAMVLRTPVSDNKIVEKLSILLQKLSKIKSNKRFFEVYTIVSIVQEMLRNSGSDNAFLSLNLKSMLFNLNATVKTTER
ncbi:coiled-coil domain-containing protein 138-like isoform X1 [Haliotis rufescens]|uniref:coiled-coil domain-containing protein 138-like isoform X1 n=1 Tax=Haliotis rufescens TaxID=6454 RepID=UPI001EAFE2B9|nr:coiled-coil domain-containing protein 138-like isoform X1 [Haliotis rufescens]